MLQNAKKEIVFTQSRDTKNMAAMLVYLAKEDDQIQSIPG